MTRLKLECAHADTCLPDYWSGHHAAHVSVPVTSKTTMGELRAMPHDELNQGAVAGSEPVTREDSGEPGDAWYKAAHAAVNRDVKKARNYQRRPFAGLEPSADDDDDDCSVYAYFIFRDVTP